jgi:hypothetical protein
MEDAFAALGENLGRAQDIPIANPVVKSEWLERRPSDPEDVQPDPETKSSFGVKETGVSTVTLYSGYINQMGYPNVVVAETEVTGVTGTSAESPCYITLRVNKTTAAVTIEALASNPASDDGTYWNRVLWEAYAVDGAVTVSKDRRHDWNMGSPL